VVRHNVFHRQPKRPSFLTQGDIAPGRGQINFYAVIILAPGFLLRVRPGKYILQRDAIFIAVTFSDISLDK